MKASIAENRRVAAALLYLQASTLAGAVRLRLRRLRQPKYLLGALLFVLYFTLVFGPAAWQAHAGGSAQFGGRALDAIAWLATLAYFAWAVLSWLFPGGRAQLRFSEAEIGFLFPAPLTRVGLINFSLLRAQLPVFLSAFLLSLLFGRGRGLPGNALQHATALWLAVATLRLHSLGASFSVARYVERGERAWLRRALAPALVLTLLVGLLLWVALSAPPMPALDGDEGVKLFGRWLGGVLQSPPLVFVLAPFRWLAAPLVSGDARWWLSLLPVLALLLLHYLWVVRANIAFEEASIEAAARRARQAENLRMGRWPWNGGKRSANNEPFALPAHGPPALAFLWSGLIGAGGGFWRPRIVLPLVLASLLLLVALAASPWASVLGLVSLLAMIGCGFSVLFGAMLMQGRLQQLLEVLDIYKAAPLSGRQIALGQLLTPMALATMEQWFLLLVFFTCLLAGGYFEETARLDWADAAALALLGPLLCALLMCIPFAWILWFPAWAAPLGSRGGGFEAAGQRAIFGFVYLFAAALASLPALLVAALAGWAAVLLGLPVSLCKLAAALAAAVVLAVELAAIVQVLGARIDRLDVSTELR